MRLSRTSKTSFIGYIRFTGTNRFRSSVKGECSENARFTCGSSSVSLIMPGITPTVETLTRREEMPRSSGDVMMRSASKILGFASGSPMPMSEMLSTLCCCCKKCSTWSATSSALSWRFRPTRPVAQNAHWNAQPACEEMQSDRCVLNCRDTASTRTLSRNDRSSTFCARSPSTTLPCAKEVVYLPKRSFSCHCSPFGMLSMSCHFFLCAL
mmetsp:Transcript_119926/g.339957  ORF Transcript_119926/g.339957 Transcript_119926/m.339957 type:complete len:211 (+) Transcript_119926:539-1171(+)